MDALTGLANRHRFDTFVRQEWQRARCTRLPLVRRVECVSDLARDRDGIRERYRPRAINAERSSPSTSSITSA